MILVRTGPRFLFFLGKDKGALMKLLAQEPALEQKPLEEAIELSGEGDSILFVWADWEEREQLSSNSPVILARSGSSPLLISIFNTPRLQSQVKQAALGPGFLMMKTASPEGGVIEKVKQAYGAETVTMVEAIRRGHSEWCMVCFTDQPLSQTISTAKMFPDCLLIERGVLQLYRELRLQAVKLFTEDLAGGSWREVTINIYDSKSLYNIHYQRVTTVIEGLELGLILGETWSVDQAFVLMSVPVFQVRLFTHLGAEEVKKIAMALEYDAEGNRIADLDLYYKRKKLEWGAFRKELGNNRAEISAVFRTRYLDNLPPAAKRKLVELDGELPRTDQ